MLVAGDGGFHGDRGARSAIGVTAEMIQGDQNSKHVSRPTCGAPRPRDADAHAPLYATHEAFSKKAEIHAAAIAVHFMWCNLVKVHQTVRMSPPMAAGVTERSWEAEDIIGLLD